MRERINVPRVGDATGIRRKFQACSSKIRSRVQKMCRFATVIVCAGLSLAGAPALAEGGSGSGSGKGGVFVQQLPPVAGDPAGSALSCSQTYGTIVGGASACAGFYSGNIFGNSNAQLGMQNAALVALSSPFTVVRGAGNADGATFVPFGSLRKTEDLLGGDTISFGKTLYGQTIIGAHFGNIAGNGGNVSVVWLFDFGPKGANGVRLANAQGFSNAVLYSSLAATAPVPEPGSWAMLVLAFGCIGGAVRRSKQTRVFAAA